MTTESPGARRIGVLGGTFDPIHIGHLIAASEACDAFGLESVYFSPAGRPWQKARYSDPEDRFMMTQLAITGHPRFAASRVELDRRGPTYTVDTLRLLTEFFDGAARLYFIAGRDAVAQMGTWERLEELAELAEVIAVTRAGFRGVLTKGEGWPAIHELEMPGVAVSATEIRKRVREGRPIDFLTPPAVVRYIKEQGLYSGTTEEADAG